MKIRNIIPLVLIFLFLISIVSASLNVSLADHGSNIRNKSSGELLSTGDLRVEIYNAASAGTLIYNETFNDVIYNGSWNIMLGENSSNPLPLEYGKIYYKDYLINGENVNFTNLTGHNVDRQFFYSPLGDVSGEDMNWTNFSTVYGYALNSSLWSLNYSNFSVTYGYTMNNTFTQNASTESSNNYIINGTGGAYIYHNGTGWVIKG